VEDRSDSVSRSEAKDNAVRPILTSKNLQLVHRLAYADYNNPGFTNRGFVYGWNEGSFWRFHVHSLTLIGKPVVSKLGYHGVAPKRFDQYIGSSALPGQNTL
jgi:hypothetical protein